MNFPGKKGSDIFWQFQLSTMVQKSEKNEQPIPNKNAELLMDRQTDRQRTMVL